MPASICCNPSDKQSIKFYLLTEISKMMSNICESEDAVDIRETEEGLEVEFPIGEIYGYASDYVQYMPDVFQNIKNIYPDIVIFGIVYEYETRQEVTFGPLFYCGSDDTVLTVTYEWQECACCGRIVETDAFYNSSQRDFKEGNLVCLCSPTCALEYAVSMRGYNLQPNASLDRKQRITIYDSDDEEKELKKLLLERIFVNRDEYKDDFIENKKRIAILSKKKGLATDQKNMLGALLSIGQING